MAAGGWHVARNLISELIVPPEHGKGLIIKKGQTLRIIAIEGAQVADLAFINQHDHRDSYSASLSYMANALQGTGNYYRFRYLHSRLPRANLLVEITDDRVGRHWLINGGHCSNRSSYFRRIPPSSRTCHSNVAEVIAEYGMTVDEVPNTFPLWMCVEDLPNGDYDIRPSLVKEGDYVDFLAHMDVLVAVSSCPGDRPWTSSSRLNAGRNKPLKAAVWEGTD